MDVETRLRKKIPDVDIRRTKHGLSTSVDEKKNNQMWTSVVKKKRNTECRHLLNKIRNQMLTFVNAKKHGSEIS